MSQGCHAFLPDLRTIFKEMYREGRGKQGEIESKESDSGKSTMPWLGDLRHSMWFVLLCYTQKSMRVFGYS